MPDTVFPNAGVEDKTAYKQAGNAVNVGVVKFVAATLFADAGVPWGATLAKDILIERAKAAGLPQVLVVEDDEDDEDDAA